MKALAVIPGQKNSLHIEEIHPEDLGSGEILCELVALGICGTDVEISEGKYGKAPDNSEYLILGHESLGRVLEVPNDSQFKAGDLVMGFVRRPDPVPCANCARGEWDFCQNGLFKERGIKELHGYGSEQFRVEEKFLIKIEKKLGLAGVLLEPTSVVAKAWDQVDKIADRGGVKPKKVLVTGAGPVGLLAAMIGRQKNLEMHVLDHNEKSLKSKLVKDIGAEFHSDLDGLLNKKIPFDVMLECTGAPVVVRKLMENISTNGILCLTGVSSGGRKIPMDIGALNRDIVLENEVIFGTVNANRKHYELAGKYLAAADGSWLSRLLTKKVSIDNFADAFNKGANDVKALIYFNSSVIKAVDCTGS